VLQKKWRPSTDSPALQLGHSRQPFSAALSSATLQPAHVDIAACRFWPLLPFPRLSPMGLEALLFALFMLLTGGIILSGTLQCFFLFYGGGACLRRIYLALTG